MRSPFIAIQNSLTAQGGWKPPRPSGMEQFGNFIRRNDPKHEAVKEQAGEDSQAKTEPEGDGKPGAEQTAGEDAPENAQERPATASQENPDKDTPEPAPAAQGKDSKRSHHKKGGK